MAKNKILVIEDDVEIQELITYHLVREGFLVTYHTSGEAGLEEIRQRLPDLAVIDVTLPGMDGWEVGRRLRAHTETSALPLLMLTASAEECASETGRDVKAEGCITKPIIPELLLTLIRSILQPNKRKKTAVRSPRNITARKVGKRA